MTELEQIKKRLFSVLPVNSLHMLEFLKLLDVKLVDEETKTAAVTCSSRPILLLNKTFINEYCKTDEHLFMLVMHELYHIILGHTHLFSRHSDIDNIAFDAVINALLCKQFNSIEYTSFFENINNDSSFPGCLLRPIGENTPSKFKGILNELYNKNTGTYFEIYQCIIEEIKKNINGKYVLIGNHEDSEDSTKNPLLDRLLDDIISTWPREILVNGRDFGGNKEIKRIEFQNTKLKDRKKMKDLLLKSGISSRSLESKRKTFQEIKTDAISFVPDFKDRTLLTKSMIYNQPLLYNSCAMNKRITNKNKISTLIYLDVSGSVVNDINKFASLLLKPYENKECKLFVFSTIVVPVSYKDFRNGKYETTGGTTIDCVFEHYFSLKMKDKPNKILILTDGYVGSLRSDLKEKLKESKIKVYCGLFTKNKSKADLQDIACYIKEF